MMETLPRALILLGLVLVVAGLLLQWGVPPGFSWLGRLPGDIRIERPGLRIFIPITTSLVLSLVLTLVLWILSRLR